MRNKALFRAGIGMLVFAWAGVVTTVSLTDVSLGAAIFFAGFIIAGLFCVVNSA